MNPSVRELSYEQAALYIDEDEIRNLETGSPPETIIGQPRALQALTMAAEMNAPGYNVFVTGPSGTGRHTAVKRVLEERALPDRNKSDIVLVYNFKDSENPRVLYLPPGEAVRFKEDVHQMVENLKGSIKTRLDGGEYTGRRDRLVSVIEQEENRALAEFEEYISKDGFHLTYINEESGGATEIVPEYEGKPTSFDILQSKVVTGDMSDEEWASIRERYYRIVDELKDLYADLREARDSMEEELEALRAEAVMPVISAETSLLRKRYADTDAGDYIDELEEDLAANLYLFTLDKELFDEMGNPRFIRYGVNILKAVKTGEPAPVVYENHPSVWNLFGSVSVRTDAPGENRTSFMMIRGGSLIKASGGFLILPAEPLFREEGTWYHLKRFLQSGKVEIQPQVSSLLPSILQIKPEPVAVDVRIVVLGPENLYDSLCNEDPDFRKYFKLHAAFDSRVERSNANTAELTVFFHAAAERLGTPAITESGICALLEQAVRLAGKRNKLSTRFSLLSDYVAESGYWAGKNGKEGIDRDSVYRSAVERSFLSDSGESELDEMIVSGKLNIHLDGFEAGRVNGLALYEREQYSFGKPAVITATVAPGRRGVVNIDREAGLSGELHTKGMLILEGFLRSRYAAEFPLSIYASICFEQSYGRIDGDSASSTEIYALLSAISGIPLRQDIAVTGSVNQIGEIQPVGGLTEKIEGFFRTCKRKGLSGTQGVVIPESNTDNCLLDFETGRALAEGRFHVYPVSTVDEGMELLTGKPADGINQAVAERLKSMAETVKERQR